ncbi:hypothetical protein [Yoonia maritima]|uniref:hypothetical protein n=1 Tax=Yoonia maritima TaxID=1435347 RepID=UPI000D1114DE|nr:hypothetical protein [Yoonia maritima]
MNEILVPLAAADLIDRIALLQLQIDNGAGECTNGAAVRQKNLLDRLAHRVLPDDVELHRMRLHLYEARCDLYAIEEDLRACDERAEFGVPFVALTRAFLASRDALEDAKAELRDHLSKPLLINEEHVQTQGHHDV